jgi:hypothetical protein
MGERYSIFFKPSRLRLAAWWLQVNGFQGDYYDLMELDRYMRGTELKYPNVCQRRWPLPIGKLYGYQPKDFDWGLCNEVVSGFSKVTLAHKEYIRKSINEGKGRLLVKELEERMRTQKTAKGSNSLTH